MGRSVLEQVAQEEHAENRGAHGKWGSAGGERSDQRRKPGILGEEGDTGHPPEFGKSGRTFQGPAWGLRGCRKAQVFTLTTLQTLICLVQPVYPAKRWALNGVDNSVPTFSAFHLNVFTSN